MWYFMYVTNGEQFINDPIKAKKFVHRFGVSMKTFRDVLAKFRVSNVHSEQPDCSGRTGNPFEILILGSFRILTRNWVFDDLYENTRISIASCQSFFHMFMKWYSDNVAMYNQRLIE